MKHRRNFLLPFSFFPKPAPPAPGRLWLRLLRFRLCPICAAVHALRPLYDRFRKLLLLFCGLTSNQRRLTFCQFGKRVQ